MQIHFKINKFNLYKAVVTNATTKACALDLSLYYVM